MQGYIWRKIKEEVLIWRWGALTGIVFLVVITIARLTGSLQFFEWMALDSFLRIRPAEPTDNRVVLIGINEADIKNTKTYPIPDKEIAELIQRVQQYQPQVIGIDIIRDRGVEPGHTELVKIFNENKNIIGIEKILPPQLISSPQSLLSEQVGFSDLIPDEDGKYRRYLLWTTNPQDINQDKFSLALRLSSAYLASQGTSLETGIRDPNTIRFGTTEIPRLLSNSGGYVRTDANGVKVLVNFRTGKQPFRILSLNDIKTGNFQPSWLRDRIVLVGITAPSVPDYFNTSAITDSQLHGQIYGVEYHAHVVSQIINTVIEQRPSLTVWSDTWEYLWIICWGVYPIIITGITPSLWKNILAVGSANICILTSGYLLLVWCGLWIPIVPSLLAINGVGYYTFSLSQHARALKSKLEAQQAQIEAQQAKITMQQVQIEAEKAQAEERQRAITDTFNQIHNGPLQILKYILRHLKKQDLSSENLVVKLETIDYDIRNICEHLQIEALTKDESLLLASGLKLNLKLPIHELFYEIYTNTLKRDDLDYLKNIKVKIRDFKPIDDELLTIEYKRELCMFLEEALCNVGQYAKNATSIEAIGKNNQGWYNLSIKDNGCSIISNSEGNGTKLGKNLAKKLGGNFQRLSIPEGGVLCEISWFLQEITKSQPENHTLV